MQQKIDHTDSKRISTFGCNKDQQSKVMYSGQEKHYYGRDSPGPGNYHSTDNIAIASSVRSASQYSMPNVIILAHDSNLYRTTEVCY